MKAGRSPNYRLKSPHHVGEYILPVDAYVRPIELHYVPKDTLERLGRTVEWMNHELEVVCYTRLGMVIIPRDKLQEC